MDPLDLLNVARVDDKSTLRGTAEDQVELLKVRGFEVLEVIMEPQSCIDSNRESHSQTWINKVDNQFLYFWPIRINIFQCLIQLITNMCRCMIIHQTDSHFASLVQICYVS